MNLKTALLALVALPSVEACPFSHLGGENPHEQQENALEDDRMLLENATKDLKARNLQTGRFVGTPEEAIEAASEEIADIVRSSRRLGPKFVRLGFHDCVGGSCDGCVDLGNPDNDGLDVPIDALVSTVNFYQDQLTRADVWALAALTAAETMPCAADARSTKAAKK